MTDSFNRIMRGLQEAVEHARGKSSPFEPLVPNETTIAAMCEAREGNLKSFDSVEALMADLHTQD